MLRSGTPQDPNIANRPRASSRQRASTAIGGRKASHQPASDTPAFTIVDEKIPDRNKSIRPDVSRSYLTALPARYEQAKLKNVITRSLRSVAVEQKQIFEGQS